MRSRSIAAFTHPHEISCTCLCSSHELSPLTFLSPTFAPLPPPPPPPSGHSDGAQMAKDVHSALLRILSQHLGVQESTAVAHMAAMVKEGRYIRDVWS